MNPYHRFHRRFIAKRQGLSGVLGGLVGPSPGSTSASAASQTSDGGIIGGITSLFGGGGATTDSSAHSSTSSSPLTQSSSSAGSTTTSHSSPSASSITPSTSPTSTTHATPSSPTPTPSAPVVFTSSDGTSIVYVTSTPPAASATSSSHPSFLQDPSLEGGVFTLVGVVILVIIFLLVSWTIRKRRRDRLESEFAAAVSFDPSTTALYERHEETMEKRRLSVSSSGHGHGYGYGMAQLAYAPQQDYRPQGSGQYPAVSYCPPPPIPYQPPPPAVLQPAQGGANLTRKFSDHKPVPPVFPEPTHDPANTGPHVPPQVYQQ